MTREQTKAIIMAVITAGDDVATELARSDNCWPERMSLPEVAERAEEIMAKAGA